MKSTFLAGIVALLMCFLVTSSSYAQGVGASGGIRGTVTDATGAANQGDTRYDLYLGDGSLAAQNAWVSYHSPNDFCMFDCYRQDYLL